MELNSAILDGSYSLLKREVIFAVLNDALKIKVIKANASEQFLRRSVVLEPGFADGKNLRTISLNLNSSNLFSNLCNKTVLNLI